MYLTASMNRLQSTKYNWDCRFAKDLVLGSQNNSLAPVWGSPCPFVTPATIKPYDYNTNQLKDVLNVLNPFMTVAARNFHLTELNFYNYLH